MSFVMYKVVLVSSIFLIVAGFLLTAFSIFSPLWQILDKPSTYTSHQHGIWWDCIVSLENDGKVIPLRELAKPRIGKGCHSKFDPESQTRLRAAIESTRPDDKEELLHRFLPHHKAVLFFSVFTFVFGSIGIIIGACSPCFPPNSLLYVVAIFMTGSCSIMGDVIFLYAANKEVPPNEDHANGAEFQQYVGPACYIHLMASGVFVSALFFSVLSSYLLISSNHGHDGCCSSQQDYNRWRGRSRRTIDQKACRPFVVVVDGDSL